MTLTQPHPRAPQVLADMQRWLERAVIGLNLCPFAKAVHVKGQIHYAITAASDAEAMPLPREDTTPPVTQTYLVMSCSTLVAPL